MSAVLYGGSTETKCSSKHSDLSRPEGGNGTVNKIMFDVFVFIAVCGIKDCLMYTATIGEGQFDLSINCSPDFDAIII